MVTEQKMATEKRANTEHNVKKRELQPGMILFSPADAHKAGVVGAIRDYQDSHKRRKAARKEGQKQVVRANVGTLW